MVLFWCSKCPQNLLDWQNVEYYSSFRFKMRAKFAVENECGSKLPDLYQSNSFVAI